MNAIMSVPTHTFQNKKLKCMCWNSLIVWVYEGRYKFSKTIISKMSSTINYTILFHGNCIDGWFSAYIAHSVLKTHGEVKMYPISPSQSYTWPNPTQMSGTHILLLDVSVPQVHRDSWISRGALSVCCIDHHESSIKHWTEAECPINTTSCAALQCWLHFYPGVAIPTWLYHIDRIDRWDNPSYEDRCVREVLNIIAHKPVEKKLAEAFALTEMFLSNIKTSLGQIMVIAQGKQLLDKKDAELFELLNKGSLHTFTEEYINGWDLPKSWLGASAFIIDTTGITLDTTESAHVVFQYNPSIDMFINYRKKTVYGKTPVTTEKTMYIYSARSQKLDLTDEHSVLRGHKTSAGATLVKGDVPVLPFILTPV